MGNVGAEGGMGTNGLFDWQFLEDTKCPKGCERVSGKGGYAGTCVVKKGFVVQGAY